VQTPLSTWRHLASIITWQYAIFGTACHQQDTTVAMIRFKEIYQLQLKTKTYMLSVLELCLCVCQCVCVCVLVGLMMCLHRGVCKSLTVTRRRRRRPRSQCDTHTHTHRETRWHGLVSEAVTLTQRRSVHQFLQQFSKLASFHRDAAYHHCTLTGFTISPNYIDRSIVKLLVQWPLTGVGCCIWYS